MFLAVRDEARGSFEGTFLVIIQEGKEVYWCYINGLKSNLDT